VAADEKRKGAAVVARDDRKHQLGIGRLRPLAHRR
jgi:ribosome biogenesis protein Nip4